MKWNQTLLLVFGCILSLNTFATPITVTIHSTLASHAINHGTITLTKTRYGTLITPDLHDLPPGPHGFHLHENPACTNSGKAAGGHYDPKDKNEHLGPYHHGHLGDLPVLWVDQNGKATTPILAPHLKPRQFLNHSLVIHAGGDNYSDTPEKLGGGAARIACGVVTLSENTQNQKPKKTKP